MLHITPPDQFIVGFQWDLLHIKIYKTRSIRAQEHSRFGSTWDPRGQPPRHMEQLLLETSCDLPAGIGASLRTHTRTTHNRRMDRQT